MSEMVERVARAIFDECAKDSAINVLPWEAQDQDDFRRQARAAIAAMREPTETIEDAARGLWLWYGGGCGSAAWTLGKHNAAAGYNLSLTPEEAALTHTPKHVCGRIAWRTMIDAALNK